MSLKPCPLCECKDIYLHFTDPYLTAAYEVWIICPDCDLRIVRSTEEEVTRAWNTRGRIESTPIIPVICKKNAEK